ncbi:MAG: TcpQ domain-containing protein [Gallionellaceae bacterium]|jgi:hypothetical protein
MTTTHAKKLFVLMTLISFNANAAFYEETTADEPQKPVVNIVKIQEWEILKSDKELSSVVKRWATRAGKQFSWEVGGGVNDVPLEGINIIFEGSFESAMEQMKLALANGSININLCYYPNFVRVVDVVTPCVVNSAERK